MSTDRRFASAGQVIAELFPDLEKARRKQGETVEEIATQIVSDLSLQFREGLAKTRRQLAGSRAAAE